MPAQRRTRGAHLYKSRYNVEALSEGGEHLLYNTANAAFAVLDERGYAAYCADGGIWAEELARAGFLTELSPDEELERQQALFDAHRVDHEALTLVMVPTYVCNYRCPYCYESGHNKIPGFMSERALAAICDFIEQRYADHAFSRLEVQWYGGDPSLCLDVVKRATDAFRAFCAQVGADYDAMMLSNCNVVDDEAAALIAECGISFMYMTIDGPEEHHNKRRVAVNGTNSYEKAIEAARALRAHGVRVGATMNADKTLMPLYPEFAEKLLVEEGIVLETGQLNDYGHFYGTGDFCAPEFDLYTHEEYACARYKYLDAGKRTASELHEMLAPHAYFCNGQKHDYYVIDLLGDVYKCDGWVGDKRYVKFNLFDDPSTWQLEIVSHDATRDERCSQCALLPICHGSCIWERTLAIPETGEMPCHPLKLTIGDYLRDYRACFDGEVDGVRVLVQPMGAIA